MMSLTIPTKKRLCIHVIGAGGTGSYAVPYLARLLAGPDNGHSIYVYDGDRVEPKNLKRQNFSVLDLDVNKADAVCRHVKGEILHAPEITAVSGYIADKDELLAEILTSLEDDMSLIIMMAVDNVATRKLINEMVMTDLVTAKIPTIVLDCGNNSQGGQVVLYGNASATWKTPFGTPSHGMLPNMLQIYPELAKIEDDNPGLVQNCADNAESEPQAMMANVRNGELLAHIVARIYETNKVPGNLWRSDILTGNTTLMFTGFLGGTT